MKNLEDQVADLTAENKRLREVAKATKALLDRCDREGLLLGGGRNDHDEKEGPMVRRIRKALKNVPKKDLK